MKIKYLLQMLVLTVFINSCNITDLDPLDSLSDPTYWKNIKDLELYSNNLYTSLTGPGVDKDNQSDDFITTNYNSFLFDEYVIPTSGGGYAYADWGTIRTCNYFLKRYHTVVSSEASINRYVGEIRFFRAWQYFAKIKRFGDVPWLDADLNTDDADLFKKRDPRDFIVSKIIEDLEFAVKWLPTHGDMHTGRLTKEAAHSLIARVCLHEGTFRKYHALAGTGDITAEKLIRKAADHADSVMATGYYDIVKGSDVGSGQKAFVDYPLHYSNQFVQEDLAQNKECILPRIYIVGKVMHHTGRQAGEAGTGLTKDFAESYLSKDGLPIALSSLYAGDESLDDEIKDRDPRMYQSIDNWHKPYTIINGVQQTNPFQNVSPSGSVSGYPCVKFRSPLTVQAEANKTTYDWFIFRYAEILLIYAEAKAELGECTIDVLDTTINLLRTRVGMPKLTVSPVADPNAVDYGYSVTPLLYEIRRERRVELVAEGFRFDDIVRWKAGKLLENPKTFLGIRVTQKVIDNYPENTFGDGGRAVIEYMGKTYLRPYTSKELNNDGRKWTVKDKRYLYPIPLDQLTVNPDIGQNGEWGK